MKILFLCGVFAQENENEIIEHACAPVEYSANIFQQKLISGFKEQNVDFEIVSAPFIGSYPNASDIKFFNGFKSNPAEYTYVPFNNIWGIRNYSRAAALKKALDGFIAANDNEKYLLIYSAHTPFVEAADYAKKRDGRIKTCMIVPDLPQYMNLSDKQSVIYKVSKKYDIYRLMKFARSVDSFVLLTESMNDVINTKRKPSIIIEGIADSNNSINTPYSENYDSRLRYIVYSGKLNKKFGILDLLSAFSKLDNAADYRLVVCGSGECAEDVISAANDDSRIIYLGQVTPSEAKLWMTRADVLVNPRPNNEVYTRYSFPSKNIEYLQTGKPVVAYMLSGMKDIYSQFIITVEEGNDRSQNLKQALDVALSLSDNVEKSSLFNEYVKENLLPAAVARRIIKLLKQS